MQFRDTQLYVLLLECTTKEAPEVEAILKSDKYVNKHDAHEIYRIYYKYYSTFESAIIDLADISVNYPEQVLFPRHRLGTHYIRIQINNRFGYLHDVNSAFEIMLHNRIENPATV
jgi:hypothetical protein